MNRILSQTLKFALLLLSSLAALMGGYAVADVSVWVSYFISFAEELVKSPTQFILTQVRTFSNLEQKFDRILFLQVNDPLLI